MAFPASADAAAETRMRDQLRQTITDLRQLQDENAELKTKLARPAIPVVPPEELHKQQLLAEQSRAAAAQAKKDADELRKQIEELKQQLAASQAAATESSHGLQETKNRLQAATKDGDALQVRFDGCQAKNRQLTSLFDELLVEFDHRGVIDALLAREPLTGLKRAQLERLTDEYRTRSAAMPDGAKGAANAGK
jgi:chromosome segregation ATPase